MVFAMGLGCSKKSNDGGTGGTTAGSYTVTVTGTAGSITQGTEVIVTVN